MDWIDIALGTWIICGMAAYILGLAWDIKRERLYHHILITLVMYGIVCLCLGPFALVIVLDLWLKHRG